MAGLAADARQLVNKAREEAAQYRKFYGAKIPGKVLGARLGGHVHTHTLYWYLRPFGCSVLVASYGDDGPSLHMIEPSGVYYKYYATAIGKHTRSAKSELEKLNFEELTCREALQHVATLVYKLHDDIKDKDFELELSWVCDESGRKHSMVPEDLRQQVVAVAKAAKEKADMEDSDDDDSDAEGKE